MALFFRAIALDFDGTLAEDGLRPADDVLEAVKRARDAGYATILVTGRILAELRAVFPDVGAHFDAIVAENGGVLEIGGTSRLIAPPVRNELWEALASRGESVRKGRVLIAGAAAATTAVNEEIRRIGLDNQLVYNRSELMIMPAGVTKGTGLIEALDVLGISRHNSIAVGDAENDLALISEAELGAAVQNAVDSVKLQADMITDRPNGSGVRELLDGPIVQGGRKGFSDRRRVELGRDARGHRVGIPAAQLNLLVCGDTGSGKSHLAGLFAERLIALGYCTLVIDPEGDHLGLTRLRNTIRYSSATGGLPQPARVVETLRGHLKSIVLDMSGMGEPNRTDYLTELGAQVEALRRLVGLPHWLLTDEAQDAPDSVLPTSWIPTQSNWGHALVSWQPDRLEEQTLRQLDAVLAVAGDDPASDAVRAVVARVGRMSPDVVGEILGGMTSGQAFLAARPSVAEPGVFTIAGRLTHHVRHWHKYMSRPLAPERRFYFRDENDAVIGAASNLADFNRILSSCGPGVIRHHADDHDFSRWIRRVFQDDLLADTLGRVEVAIRHDRLPIELARLELVGAIRRRYHG